MLRSLMKWIFALVAMCAMLGTAQAASVTLAWNAPTTNTDGSPLTNLASYMVYRGVNGATPVGYGSVSGPTPTFVDTMPAVGTNLYYVTAINSVGTESGPSNTVTFQMFQIPSPPTSVSGTVKP
jgi:hypothetical protein